MTYQSLTLTTKGNVGYIILNRPETQNAIDQTLAEDLSRAAKQINEDDEIRVVIVAGSGEVFSSDGASSDEFPSGLASNSIASLNSPVIAAINGDALGSGLELAMACDIRIATEKAQFGLSQVLYGSIPAGGGTQRLPRIVGRGKALEMILTASIIDAAEAYRIGLVNEVVPSAELDTHVSSLAEKLTSKGPIALKYAKESINKGLDMPLRQGLGLEADLSFLLQSTADRDEGIKAFMEKRAAEFRGE